MSRQRQCSRQTHFLLENLVEAPGSWRYGYELSQATALKSGTLYPILMRLADRGLLESRWVPAPKEGRPPRHMYRLTKAGVAFAREQLADRPQRAGVSMRPQTVGT